MTSTPMTRWSNKNVTERCTHSEGETGAVQHAREHSNRINKHLQNVLLGLWLDG